MPGETAEYEAELDEVVEVEKPEAEAEKPEAADTESRARKYGWHPKDEYEASGRDPAKWVDANEFIRRGEEELPVLRERNRTLERKYTGLEKKLEEGHGLLRDLVKNQNERERKAVEKALKEAEGKRREAISVGDVAATESLSEEIEEYRDTLKAKPPVETRQNRDQGNADIPQEVIEWAEANPWFNENKKMNAIAVAEYGDLVGDKSLTETQRLAKVKAEVVKRFPEHFSNGRRTQPAAVESGNGAARSGKGLKGWNDIPPDDRAIAERLIKSGAVKDRAAYAKDYFGS